MKTPRKLWTVPRGTDRKISLSRRNTANYAALLLISTGMSSLAAKNALVNAGADVMGMVAIFSYGFPQERKAFEDANVELNTLTNYNTLVEVAHETGYIREEDIEVLKDWRISPSTWGR